MTTPLFIIGTQRSGTTWLSNILCRHSKITGIQTEPYGIRESSFFSHFDGFFGKLNHNMNFIHFVEVFGSTDYYRSTGLTKNFLYNKHPTKYSKAFKLIMEEFSKGKGAIYWLEKSPGHSLYLRKISKYFKDAKFIYISRHYKDRIRSSLKKTHIRNYLIKIYLLFFLVLHHLKYIKHLDKFYSSNKNITLKIKYEDLRAKKTPSLKKICNFLDIEFDENLLDQKYPPNTSFSKFDAIKERTLILNKFEERIIEIFYKICNSFPYRFFRFYHILKMYRKKRKLPVNSWAILINEKLS